jgi:hypothetical protein
MLSFLTDQARPVRAASNAFMMMLIKHYRHQSSISLVDCIMSTRTFKCTDPRDHLYALLNLNTLGSTVEPDYRLTVEGVCRLLTTTILVNDQNLKVLGLCTHNPCPEDTKTRTGSEQPSWVLDITSQYMVNPLMSYTIRAPCFHAGGAITPLITISSNNRILHLKGRIVDSVKATSTCLDHTPMPSAEDVKPETGFAPMLKMWKRNWCRECRDLAAEGDWTNLSPTRKRAFAETMICGMTGMRDAAPEEAVSTFETYMAYLFDYFTPGYKLTEETREIMLTHGGLIENTLNGLVSSLQFSTTSGGRFAQVRQGTRIGDVFCVVLGAEIPFVLRPTGGSTYILIGEAFLHGMMQGEALSDPRYETVDIMLE